MQPHYLSFSPMSGPVFFQPDSTRIREVKGTQVFPTRFRQVRDFVRRIYVCAGQSKKIGRYNFSDSVYKN